MVPPASSLQSTARSAFVEGVASILATDTAAIPVVVGGCGSGRTTMLLRLQQTCGADVCQYIDIERAATTPERFHEAIVSGSPFVAASVDRAPTAPRTAYDATLAFLATARRPDGRPAMFLLDEALDLRTFESFPGLRHAVEELLNCLAATRNRFVLASRYEHRAARLLHGRRPPFAPVTAPGLATEEIVVLLRGPALDGGGLAGNSPDREAADLARIVHVLSDGRPAYADAIVAEMHSMRASGGGDPLSALTALLSPGGRLAGRCEHSYEIRLHRARGYGALKAILDVLADAQPLTLTDISRKLHRTPGSTKDYLSWLEDVDLIAVDRKRYQVHDPILRLWVRLYCHPVPPTDEAVAGEVQRYALERLASSDAVARPASPSECESGALDRAPEPA